jgi:hypothetical protein
MTLKTSLIVAIVLLSAYTLAQSSNRNTKMVVRLGRHGARSPTSQFYKLGIDWEGLKSNYEFGELIPSE